MCWHVKWHVHNPVIQVYLLLPPRHSVWSTWPPPAELTTQRQCCQHSYNSNFSISHSHSTHSVSLSGYLSEWRRRWKWNTQKTPGQQHTPEVRRSISTRFNYKEQVILNKCHVSGLHKLAQFQSSYTSSHVYKRPVKMPGISDVIKYALIIFNVFSCIVWYV